MNMSVALTNCLADFKLV